MKPTPANPKRRHYITMKRLKRLLNPACDLFFHRRGLRPEGRFSNFHLAAK